MCFEERNTLSRNRAPAAALIVRRMRALRRSACLLAMAIPLESLSLFLLAFLAEDAFVRIFHALALIGLRRPEVADFRGHLADLPLIDAAHHDFGGFRRRDRNAVRDRIDHIVAVAEGKLEVPSLDRGAITDAIDFELALEPLGNAGDEISNQGARSAPHGAGALGVGARIDLDRALVHLHRDLVGRHKLQRAFWSLHFHRLAFDARRDARRDWNRFLADARHDDPLLEYPTEDLAAHIRFASGVVRHHPLGSRKDCDPEAVVDARQILHRSIDAASGFRHPLDGANDRRTVKILKLNLEFSAPVAALQCRIVADIAFALEHIEHALAQLRARSRHFRLGAALGVADAGDHVADWIVQVHRRQLLTSST